MPAVLRAKKRVLGLGRSRTSSKEVVVALGGAVANPLPSSVEMSERGASAPGRDDELGVPEAKHEDEERNDWQTHVCDVSGLPYYYSPSRRRTTWSAPAGAADPELDDVFSRERATSRFESTNPVHARM